MSAHAEVKQQSQSSKIDSNSEKTSLRVSSNKNQELEPTLERKRKHDNADVRTDDQPETKKSHCEAVTNEEYCLFIQNIPNTAKKGDVKEAFKNFGEICHIILPLRRSIKGTTRSNYKNKGYALVKFSSKQSLSAALAQKKHKINGHHVIVRTERKAKVRGAKVHDKMGKVTKEASTGVSHVIYIGNIKKGTPCEDLEEHFSQFGDVNNVIVCPAHAKLKKPYAQVVFSSADAKTAALSTPKHMMGSVALCVGATKLDVLGADAMENLRADHELFVAKLSEDTSVETLRKHFSKYGTVTKVFQPRCPKSNKPKRCAFIAFDSERSVKAALEEDHEIDMRTLLVRDSKVDIGKKVETSTQPDVEWDHALFVARVPLDTGKETLITYFSKYGEVADVRLAWDPVTKCTKSYGLVFFCDAQALRAALSEKHKINGTEIFVKKNERKTADSSEKNVSEPRRSYEVDVKRSGNDEATDDGENEIEVGDDDDDADSDDENEEETDEGSESGEQSLNEDSDDEES
ncbi:RNA recognition motif domain [Trinorchestia longiramus]|nr:RNA recognition motif domain [Trinorchestia longiramus]